MFIALGLLSLFSACEKKRVVNDETTSLSTETKAQTQTPFSNKEPEIFQTEIVVTTTVNQKKFTKRYFVARNGTKTLTIFNFGEDNETSILESENGKSYIIKKREKVYFERKPARENSEQNELNKYLTTKWLNEKRNVKFEKLESKNNITSYRVDFEDSKNSEILIYIDDNLHLPVKQEFFETTNDKNTLVFTVELKEFKSNTDDSLFEIPMEYKDEAGQ